MAPMSHGLAWTRLADHLPIRLSIHLSNHLTYRLTIHLGDRLYRKPPAFPGRCHNAIELMAQGNRI